MTDPRLEALKTKALQAGEAFVNIVEEKAKAAAKEEAEALKKAAKLAAGVTRNLFNGQIEVNDWKRYMSKIETLVETDTARIAREVARASVIGFLQGAAKFALGLLALV